MKNIIFFTIFSSLKSDYKYDFKSSPKNHKTLKISIKKNNFKNTQIKMYGYGLGLGLGYGCGLGLNYGCGARYCW